MEAITDGKVNFLNGNLDYMERFGILIGADKKVPKKDGIPFFQRACEKMIAHFFTAPFSALEYYFFL